MKEDDISLVNNFIAYWEQTKHNENDKDSPNEKLEELISKDTLRGLRVMYAVADKSSNMQVLSCLGSGPLENFLNAEQSSIYLDEIISRSYSSENWKNTLGCVWTTSFKNTTVTEKIEKCINQLFPDGRP